MIGRALNHAARIATVGDQSQVVVSETFYESSDARGWSARFSEPIEVSVKHGRLATVRLYHGTSSAALFNRDVPRRVRFLQDIDNEIFSHLSSLTEILLDFHKEMNIAPDVLKPRLTIFVPDDTREKLICTGYRYHWEREREKPGKTTYSIGTGRAEGPLGNAYCDRKPVVVRGLPDPKTDIDAYVNAWLTRPEGAHLARQHILGSTGKDGWSRKPRAMIAIRFAEPSSNNDGVLCIDTRHPLDTLTEDQVQSIFNLLATRLNKAQVAWLLRVRRSV